jgi:hypothetical protein
MTKERLLTFLALVFFFTNLALLGVALTLRQRLVVLPAEVFVVEEYRPADIEVDVGANWGSVLPFWQSFAQGGEELGGTMLASTVGPMQPLAPRYVRLDHIFDDDYYGVVKGPGQYDFSRLDATVSNIRAMGAKPFFSLSYMPSSIADTKISVPRNWDDWYNLVQATVRHYSGRDGLNLSDVYYEVWNEPDLESFGAWKRGGDKSYLTLYSVSARAAAAAGNTNRFYIGGPATTALYRNWVVDLVNFAASNNLRLDFISWHRYSFDPNRFLLDMQETYDWLGDARDNYQWLITEWGPTPEKSGTYGTTYASAHAFAVVRQLLDFSDEVFAFEVKDGPEQGNQGWGLLAHDSAGLYRKPRYGAFSWLRQAYGDRVKLTGEGTNVTGWAVKRASGELAIYLVNFTTSGGQEETVPVRFVGLEPGEYQINQRFLVNPGRNSTSIASTTSGRVFLTVVLPANDVVEITLPEFQVATQAVGEPVSPGQENQSGTPTVPGFGKMLNQ